MFYSLKLNLKGCENMAYDVIDDYNNLFKDGDKHKCSICGNETEAWHDVCENCEE
jgi:predicted amidophosphoribosyltransferase